MGWRGYPLDCFDYLSTCNDDKIGGEKYLEKKEGESERKPQCFMSRVT